MGRFGLGSVALFLLVSLSACNGQIAVTSPQGYDSTTLTTDCSGSKGVYSPVPVTVTFPAGYLVPGSFSAKLDIYADQVGPNNPAPTPTSTRDVTGQLSQTAAGTMSGSLTLPPGGYQVRASAMLEKQANTNNPAQNYSSGMGIKFNAIAPGTPTLTLTSSGTVTAVTGSPAPTASATIKVQTNACATGPVRLTVSAPTGVTASAPAPVTVASPGSATAPVSLTIDNRLTENQAVTVTVSGAAANGATGQTSFAVIPHSGPTQTVSACLNNAPAGSKFVLSDFHLQAGACNTGTNITPNMGTFQEYDLKLHGASLGPICTASAGSGLPDAGIPAGWSASGSPVHNATQCNGFNTFPQPNTVTIKRN